MKSNELFQKIATIKHTFFGSTVVCGKYNGQDFRLIVLTQDVESNDVIIDLLSKWRKKHEYWFPQQFPIHRERTRKWFREKVIEEKDRILLLIQIAHTYIGHVGLYRFDLSHNSCEIDNIVRGEDGFPGLMQYCIEEMMKWGRKELGLQTYSLETTSDNSRALQLYTKLGFKEKKRIALIYTKTVDGGFWSEAPKDYTGEIIRYNVYMNYEAE